MAQAGKLSRADCVCGRAAQTPDKSQTKTQLRHKIFLNLPTHMLAWVEAARREQDVSMAAFVRSIIKWHASSARCARKGPKVVLPERTPNKAKDRSPKQILVDTEDFDHLDAIGRLGGLTRNAAIALILLAWFEVDPLTATIGLR